MKKWIALILVCLLLTGCGVKAPADPETTAPPETVPQPTEPQVPPHVCDYTRREVIMLCALCAATGLILGTLLMLLIKRFR